MAVGLIGMAKPKADNPWYKVEGHARTAMTNLASARRTHRWCKEFPVLMAIPASLKIANPLDMVLDLVQKASLATFMMIDHIGHLKQWKIIPGGKRAGTGTIQLGLKFFCFSNFIAAIVQLKKLWTMRKNQDEKAEAQRKKSMETVGKHLLLMLQTAHLSRLYETSDVLVGLAGIITSGMDVLAHWPERKVDAKPSAPTRPDAKEKAK